MEEKKPWNLRVFSSVADEFDRIADADHRGEKGVCASAAALLFVSLPRDTRQEWLELVKKAEVRGWAGSILDAAKGLPMPGVAPQPSTLHHSPTSRAKADRLVKDLDAVPKVPARSRG